MDKIVQDTLELVKRFVGNCEIYDVEDENLKREIVKIVNYSLVGQLSTKYDYGLLNKMFSKDYDFIKEWSWIINDNKTKITSLSLQNPIYNLSFINQDDNSGVHRSGWKYVYDNLVEYSGTNVKLPLLDLYVDRTFHWNAKIYEFLGIIPYTKPWFGIIHHTFDETFSEYNCNNLLKSKLFKKSLKHCKGLICLTNYLTETIKSHLPDVNIITIHHPTQFNVKKFTMEKYLNNDKKQLVNIGGWLRNNYVIYNLNIPKNVKYSHLVLSPDKISSVKKRYTINMTKTNLLGKEMSSYYPSSSFIKDLKEFLDLQNVDANETIKMISTTKGNKWNILFFNNVKKQLNSVSLINYLDNERYDKLLTENVVFINLIDASAVNTLLECVARNTPIIINKISPVVEILGENYPLYYSNIDDYYNINAEVTELLKDQKNIMRANRYLKSLDKSFLTIEFFIKKLLKFIKTN